MQMPPPPSMASMPTSAYISGGIGINYYTATQSSVALKNNVLAYQQQQQLLQQQQQQQQLPQAAAQTATQQVILTQLQQQAQAQAQAQQQQQQVAADSGMRRRLFAGFRPLSGLGRLRSRSSQHRSISLPESNYNNSVPTI
ncbi:uncharacterized protein DDB_G0283357-like [Anastrepha ludens]|uniref:uncharacterized protein DDB_G0283357-like n=1 Tax=Anastrepha ludens TaxID=28586 RepID=UPI0023B0D98B|nr:uncharacterized protein DDB_G0283357-like [Anastrepha ludens]